MRSYLFAGILVLAASACTDTLTGPTETVIGPPALSISGMPQCIHVTTEDGSVVFKCSRGEPGANGAPPGVYVDGVNVSGG